MPGFDPPQEREPGVSQLDQLWAACEALIPCSYYFGGRDQAAQGGLDCAGYVLEALHRIGIDLTLGQPYDTGKWYVNVERIVAQCEEVQAARPGDLIIYENTYLRDDGTPEPFSHVGIIKEPQPVGTMYDCHDVRGSGLTDYGHSAYWQSKYKMVVRVPGLEQPAADSPWTAAEIAAATGCPVSAIAKNWPMICADLTAAGQGSRASLAAAIGTVSIETASTWEPVAEAFWLPLAQRLAYYADTSQHAYYGDYFGRGFVQLSLESNYAAVGQALGVDLLGNPDLALQPDIASKALALYWQTHDLQAPADAGDWTAVRRKVQGGTAGLDRLIAIVTALL